MKKVYAPPPLLARVALIALAVAACALAACAEKKPLLPDPDQAGNYTGEAGAPTEEAADGGTSVDKT